MKKILVIDDDKEMISLISDYLKLEGFIVYKASDGFEALEMVSNNIDLILLDIMMPNMDGFTFIKRVRNFINIPIVVLSAKINSEDKIMGLKLGADDYITKPFDFEELIYRIKAHLRREDRLDLKSEIKFKDNLIIDYSSRRVFLDSEIHFTKTEFDIIELLSLNKGQVFSKDMIYEKIKGYDDFISPSVIAEHIRRIREKFKKQIEDEIITTVWGAGYRWSF